VPTNAPVISFRMPETRDGDVAALVHGETHEGQRYESLDLSAMDLEGSTFRECVLDGLSLTEAQLRGTRFVETLIATSFAPSLLASRTSWRDVRIESPRWGAAELYDADMTAVHIVGGKIDYLNLRDARLTNVLLEGCTIGELDVRRAKLSRVALRDCTINALEFDRATCKDVDIRGTEFSVVNGLDGLRGVTIDEAQLSLFAGLFARQLGVIVE